jgi:hypothetical protein
MVRVAALYFLSLEEKGEGSPVAEKHEGILSRRAFVGRVATVTAGAAVALTATTVGRAKALPHAGRLAADSQRGGDTARLASSQVEQAAPPTTVEPAPRVAESAPPPWEILAPLTAGAALTAEWKVAGLTAIEDGSSVLTLANRRGREQRVHLCRNDGNPQGLVYTDRIDLVVMNGGCGDLPTEESFGQAVAAVAHAIAANEGSQRHRQVLAKLMPQSERIERFAATPQLR